ncbi:MAG TPA: PASTA domain-containing protein [Ignavibacteria bacterium]|nr:PASTA domain-containing protein [Ignavibacteria bacterium]HMR40757.1 PASTA domain-containing protein [Ignavibacteria bacterium]
MLKKILIFVAALLVLFFITNNVIMPLYVKHADTVKVPKVIGLNFIEAKDIIENGGLEIIQGEMKYDESIPIGQIMDQNPPADETVKYGRRIYVTICGGEQLSEVPNLKGKSIRDAKFTLEQRGLKLGETVRKNTNEFPADFVVSQVIQPGSKLKKNSPIDLILSDGPTIGDLIVPNTVSKNLDEAKKIITDSKLKLGKITYQTNNELPPGQIIDQYPKSGKSANENTTVDLFVARKKVIIQQEVEEVPDGGNNDGNSDESNPPPNKKENSKENSADDNTATKDKTNKKTEQSSDKKTDQSSPTNNEDNKPKSNTPKKAEEQDGK